MTNFSIPRKVLRVAATGFRPLGQVVGRAEPVWNAVLAAVAHQEHVRFLERGAAQGAFRDAISARRLERRPRLPVRALDGPRDDVLQAAEDGAPVSGYLSRAVAVG